MCCMGAPLCSWRSYDCMLLLTKIWHHFKGTDVLYGGSLVLVEKLWLHAIIDKNMTLLKWVDVLYGGSLVLVEKLWLHAIVDKNMTLLKGVDVLYGGSLVLVEKFNFWEHYPKFLNWLFLWWHSTEVNGNAVIQHFPRENTVSILWRTVVLQRNKIRSRVLNKNLCQ